ncbi:hypothetical protein PTTG_30693, partial [Puccinia triticina 1-1 BBBD Race 1]
MKRMADVDANRFLSPDPSVTDQVSPILSVPAYSTRPPSLASTNIEVVSPTILSRGPNQGVHRSPARKIARSPHGEGIAHTISRLSFARDRSPIRPTPGSPTRKTPRSRTESLSLWISKTNPAAYYHLNDVGRSLTMEGFLEACQFPKEDLITRGLMLLYHIRRWEFFLSVSAQDLEEKFRFPFAIACTMKK